MTITDYAIDIVLIGLVAFQVHGMRLTRRGLILPLVLVGVVAMNYLKTIPTAGNDLYLIVGLTAVGATLGSLAGLFTSVRQDSSGVPVVKAGLLAAILWLAGVGSRFAFQLYVSHGGLPALGTSVLPTTSRVVRPGRRHWFSWRSPRSSAVTSPSSFGHISSSASPWRRQRSRCPVGP